MRLSDEFVKAFAAEWIAAWNSHDLDRILSHYAPDFTFASPRIVELMGEPSGTLHGHAAIRSYWARALAARPDLHFECVQTFAGVSSLAIVYSRHDGLLGCEHFEFDADGRVCRASAHYCAPAAAHTSTAS